MANILTKLARLTLPVKLAVANLTVFLLLALCSIVASFSGNAAWVDLPSSLLFMPSSFSGWLHAPWTAFTYMFTHTNPLHLLFNMLWLLWFGHLLLITHTPRHLLTLYIGGGLSGALLYIIFSALLPAFSTGALIGASASIISIMCATAIKMPSYRVHLFFIGDIKLGWVVAIMIALTLLGTGPTNLGTQAAHIGGALFGVVAALAPRLGLHLAAKTPSRPATPTQRRINRTIDIIAAHRLDQQRLDELLDKIRLSGYESLSKSERQELDDLSARL